MKIGTGMKKSLPLVATLFICTGAVVWGVNLSSTARQDHRIKPVKPVKTMVVEQAEKTVTRTFPGIARAAGEIKLSFRVGGPLIEVNVDTGEKIEKNQVIARIDPRDFKVRVKRLKAGIQEAEAKLEAMRTGAREEDIASLEADLNAAEAAFEESVQNLHRIKTLFEQQVVAKSSLERATAGFEMARARKNAASQALSKGRKGARQEDINAMEAKIEGLNVALEAATNALEDTRLRAPFTGIVNKKLIENHETVAPGHFVVTLLDLSSIEVSTSVPEEILINRERITRIVCRFESAPGRDIPGAIKEFASKTDMANQSYPLTVTLGETTDMEIFSGMAADVVFHMEKKKNQHGFAVPVHALIEDENSGPALWIVNMKTMTVHRQGVETAELNGSRAIVSGGIQPGERIVTAGAAFLKPGQKIRLLTTGSREG
ncbi:MAG: efflux RND transporter periplasmic adaptor subunit [Desulfobacteraceae bacterium]